MSKWPFGDIGPVCVIYDYGGVDLRIDPYLGTVTLRMEDSVSDVQEEGQGDAIVDGVFAGSVVEFEIPMVRNTYAVLHAVLPGTEMAVGTHYLTFSNKSGCAMYDDAVAIVLRPMCDNVCDDDQSTWIRIFKAHPYRAWEMGFDRSGQRIIMVRFKVFPNQDTGYEGEYLEFGVA